MRTIAAMILVFVCAAGSGSAQEKADPKDLTECIEQIRARGMSEGAYGAIAVIAGVRAGGASMEFRKDEVSGMYWTSFTGNRCALPNADPAEAERERMRYRYTLDTEVSLLRPLADADGSGFVSTEEGLAFRRLCEFGYKAAFVAAEEEGDRDAVITGLQVDLGGTRPEVFESRLKEYEAFREKAEALGVGGLPEVVLHE